MKLKKQVAYDKVTIRISELQTTTVTVAPWETPILLAMYGDAAEVTGSEDVKRDPPEANDEFARLAIRYGPKNEDTPLVAAVYGKFGPGVNKLANEIRNAYSGNATTGVVEADFVPELTEEQIEAISAAGDAKQTEIIESLAPKPPVTKSPVKAAKKDPLFD